MIKRSEAIKSHFQLLRELLPCTEIFDGCAEVNRSFVIDRMGHAWGVGIQVFTFDETEDWHGDLLELARFLIESRGWYWFAGNMPYSDFLNGHHWHVAYISDQPIAMPFDELDGMNHNASRISPGMALLRAYLSRLGITNIPEMG